MHEELKSDRVYAAVDVMFMAVSGGRLRLMLSKRVNEPQKGRWALPGCLIGLDESAEGAAERLRREMLHTGAYFEQLYTFTTPGRDERGRVISIAYVGIAPEIKSGDGKALFDADVRDDALTVTDENGEALDIRLLAFDHAEIIKTGVKRLRGKIDYTDIGLRFIKDRQCFALSELEDIFEAVKGESVDKSNFRRFVKGRFEDTGMISPIDKLDRQSRGRPARLYRANI